MKIKTTFEKRQKTFLLFEYNFIPGNFVGFFWQFCNRHGRLNLKRSFEYRFPSHLLT